MSEIVGGTFYISTDGYATEYDSSWGPTTEAGFYAWAASDAVYADDGFGNQVDIVGGENNVIISGPNNDYYGVSTLDQPGSGVGSTAGAVASASNVEVDIGNGITVTQDSFVNDGTGTFSDGNLNTPVEYGDFGEDLSYTAQAKLETTTADPVTYVTSMFQEIITEATNAKAGLVSDVVATELAYQSGTSNDRVIGPGIGGNSTTIDVVEGKSYVDLITSTALAVEGQDPAALAAINTGLPNPFDYGYSLETGIFASEEDAALYAQARVDNITNVVSNSVDAVITGYQVSQQFLASNTDTFTIRNADGTFQILPYTLQSQLSTINDPQVSQAIIIAIQNAGGDINGADLSLNNLERIADQYDIQAIIDEDIQADGPGIVRDTSGNPTPGGDLVARGYASADGVQSGTETFVGSFPDITTYTSEERAILNEGLDSQIVNVGDRNVTGIQEALSKAQDIEQILKTDGYGVGLDQDQTDYLKESLAGTVNYATAYAAAYALVDSAVNSIASIQTTDSSDSVTAQRQELANSLWNQLTPFEQSVARDTGLAGELDQLTRNPLNIIDSQNTMATPYTSTEILPGGVQGLVDTAIAAYISINGSITEEQAANIENAILDANQSRLSDLTAADVGVAGREFDLNLIRQVGADVTSTTQLDRPLEPVQSQGLEPAPPEPQYARQRSAFTDFATSGTAGIPTIDPTSAQQAQVTEFTSTAIAATPEAAQELAAAAAREQAVESLGNNIAFTNTDSVEITTNTDGTYSATFTTEALPYTDTTTVSDSDPGLLSTFALASAFSFFPSDTTDSTSTIIDDPFAIDNELLFDSEIVTQDTAVDEDPFEAARLAAEAQLDEAPNLDDLVVEEDPFEARRLELEQEAFRDELAREENLTVDSDDPQAYPNGLPYDDDGNLMPGWALDENNDPIWVGGDYVDPATQLLAEAAQAEAALVQAAKIRANQQATIEAQKRQANQGDWRVKLRLAEGANYLYRDPSLQNNADGILYPLYVTNGVVFPYTPTINTTYGANYNSYDLTHSNYRGYFYQNSYVDDISITATFTAQDTNEADYMLAVIHFFRSVTKMFYGQDANRGMPPPLVFLQGLGEFQFNLHPCVVKSFNYNLPSDVDYIRARTSNIDGTNLQNRRDRQTVPQGGDWFSNIRLAASGLSAGAITMPPAPATLGTRRPTYVPTKIDIQLTLLPIQTRSQVSKQFSLKQYANGDLLKGGFW
jgi:hypothetical protein